MTFRGNGRNIISIDWESDLIVVVPWTGGGDAFDTFIGKVLNGLKAQASGGVWLET